MPDIDKLRTKIHAWHDKLLPSTAHDARPLLAAMRDLALGLAEDIVCELKETSQMVYVPPRVSPMGLTGTLTAAAEMSAPDGLVLADEPGVSRGTSDLSHDIDPADHRE